MQTFAIFELLIEYILIGLKILVPAVLLFFISYYVFYIKIFKGTKRIKLSKIFLYSISIIYLIILFKATLRFDSFSTYGYSGLNLHLFSSYREAYHNIDVIWYKNILFRNIILNICLFVPLGFLLPFYSRKLRKLWSTVLVGFVVTGLIECTQYLISIGTFEIDDIFNNTLGTLLGYSFFQIFYQIKNKIFRKTTLLYLIPFFTVILSFTLIFINYNFQEFGCLSEEYNYKINMKNFEIKSNVNLSNERKTKPIGYEKPFNKDDAIKKAEDIFSGTQNMVNLDSVQEFENSTLIHSYNSNCKLWFYYNGGSFHYNYGDTMPIINGKTFFCNTVENLSKEEVIEIISKHNIQVPDMATFSEKRKYGNTSYYFSFNCEEVDNKIFNGDLNVKYYENGALGVVNNICIYNIEKYKEIISEEEAYEEIKQGKFKTYAKYNSTDKNLLEIEKVSLEYEIDSKGYYVPVYKFNTKLNNKDCNIFIKAVK